AIAGAWGSGTDGGGPVVSASSHGPAIPGGVRRAGRGAGTGSGAGGRRGVGRGGPRGAWRKSRLYGNHSCSDTRARNRTRFANVSIGTDDATRRRPPAPGAIRREGGEAPNACQTSPIAHPAG